MHLRMTLIELLVLLPLLLEGWKDVCHRAQLPIETLKVTVPHPHPHPHICMYICIYIGTGSFNLLDLELGYHFKSINFALISPSIWPSNVVPGSIFISTLFEILLYFLHVFTCMCGWTTVHVWRSEDSMSELLLPHMVVLMGITPQAHVFECLENGNT